MSEEKDFEAPNHEDGEALATAQATSDVSPIELEEFAPLGATPNASAATQNIGRVMDVSVTVSARIGRIKKTISEVLDLLPGTVIDLGKSAGDPVDLVVGEKLIARGEIVVVDEHYGVRITELIQDG